MTRQWKQNVHVVCRHCFLADVHLRYRWLFTNYIRHKIIAFWCKDIYWNLRIYRIREALCLPIFDFLGGHFYSNCTQINVRLITQTKSTALVRHKLTRMALKIFAILNAIPNVRSSLKFMFEFYWENKFALTFTMLFSSVIAPLIKTSNAHTK